MDYTRLSSDGSLIQRKPQGFLAQNSNNVYPMFLFVEGINPSSYSCEAVFTPNGSSSVTLLFPQTTLEIDGVSQAGYYLKLPDTVTKVSGAMAVNYVLKDLSGTVVFSQTVSVYVNAAGGTEWDVPLIEAQYQEIIAQIIKSKAQNLGVLTSLVGSPLDDLKNDSDSGFYWFVWSGITFLLTVSASNGSAIQSVQSFRDDENIQSFHDTRLWVSHRTYSAEWSAWTDDLSYVERGTEADTQSEETSPSAIGKGSSALASDAVAVGARSLANVLGIVSFDSSAENRTAWFKDLQYIFLRNDYVDPAKTTRAAYSDGHTLRDYIPNGTPVAVSVQWDTLVAGNSKYFSCTGSGTLIDPYVIKPTGTAAVPSARNIYYFGAPSISADVYIDFVGTTNEPCFVCIDSWDLPYRLYVTFSFLSKDFGMRGGINIGNTPLSLTAGIVSTSIYAMVDVDSPNAYSWREF